MATERELARLRNRVAELEGELETLRHMRLLAALVPAMRDLTVDGDEVFAYQLAAAALDVLERLGWVFGLDDW